MFNEEFAEDEPPTRPETPTSKSGKYKICGECNKFVEVTAEHGCSNVREDGTYSIINKVG